MEMPSATGKCIVFYDGVCAMCNGIVRFILARDSEGVFRFTPLQSETARRALEHHGQRPDDLDTMYLITAYRQPDERLFARSDAVMEALRRLGGLWSVASWLRVLPRPWRDAAYAVIVRNRYRVFGKHESCPLPPPEWQGRFLDPEDQPPEMGENSKVGRFKTNSKSEMRKT